MSYLAIKLIQLRRIVIDSKNKYRILFERSRTISDYIKGTASRYSCSSSQTNEVEIALPFQSLRSNSGTSFIGNSKSHYDWKWANQSCDIILDLTEHHVDSFLKGIDIMRKHDESVNTSLNATLNINAALTTVSASSGSHSGTGKTTLTPLHTHGGYHHRATRASLTLKRTMRHDILSRDILFDSEFLSVICVFVQCIIILDITLVHCTN